VVNGPAQQRVNFGSSLLACHRGVSAMKESMRPLSHAGAPG
jgi:hypothetical protein